MRQVTRKGLITVAAAGGVLALSGSAAFADATASGAAEGSPGVASGNTVQVPVHVPVNVCGNTVNVVGLLNPAFGNTCVNDGRSDSGAGKHAGGHHDGAHQQGSHSSGSTAEGVAKGSPGVASGNTVQVPVHVPVNACGNSVDVGGLLNPTFGNECVNGSAPSDREPPAHPDKPESQDEPEAPDKQGETVKEPKQQPSAPKTQILTQPELAQTGAGYELETVLGMGASLMLGGTILYRRARAVQR